MDAPADPKPALQAAPSVQSPAPVRPVEPQVPTPTSSDSGQPLKPNACISCQRRKVKCDRLEPCSSCKRYRAQCEFRDPAPRRKRKLNDEDLHAKLDRYESILNSFGARVDARSESASAERPVSTVPAPASAFTPLNAPRPASYHNTPSASSHEALPARPSAVAAPPPEENGRLIFEKGSSRYLENSLWKGISDEFKSPGDMLRLPAATATPTANSSTEAPALVASELVLGLMLNPPGSLRLLHPQPPHIFLLWQAFLDNVNPLIKLLHAPTVQRQILKATTNLDAVDPGIEALMFAIYTFAVVSLSPEECQSTFGESKAELLPKFQHGTKLALHRAEFLRSSQLVVLQAYILYLLAMRPYFDIQTLWSLSAVAVRMGQRIGLHQDGSKMGLPLFDIEIRRRVWWQLMPLDMRTAELAGGTASVSAKHWDVELPLNCNDSDLDPDMKQLPVEHTGPTEMFFCNMRYNFGKFCKKARAGPYFDLRPYGEEDGITSLASNNVTLLEKDRKIEALEKHLEEHFLRHCDPSVPLHYLSAIVARCALCVMRLIAHHPRRYSGKGMSLPQSEKDFLFRTTLKIVELDNLVHGDPSLQRFMWHMDAFFQWEGFIYLVSELRARTSPHDPDVQKAWFHVNKVLENHSDILDIRRSPLHLAVASLAAKAWAAHVQDAVRQPAPQPALHDYRALEVLVSTLRDARSRSPPEPSSSSSSMPQHQQQQQQQSLSTLTGFGGERGASGAQNGGAGSAQDDGAAEEWGASLPNGLDASPMDWDMWDDMLAEFGLGMDIFGGYTVTNK
ncbi:putative fungal specific transcription factor domain-containing protein [Diplodia seriata]|uniref:Putative fungal specific transcription factor domain-containing protein n=1 Tax=Diplodia seriata TaxID=420778 RepID=A0A0G2DTE4_9PEZI|nr:putative fungal specific transcription factor domain-containing protein [Diplodia seriata]